MLTKRIVLISLTIAACIVLAGPLEAKTKSKSKSASITGVYCKSGGNDIQIPASALKKGLLQKLRKGQKFSFTHGEVGSISCRVF